MRAGVLTVGSLLWGNDRRDTWRRARLRLEEKVYVRVPVRYGRRSTTRGNTFTMVFEAGGAQGQAVLVPCVADIAGLSELVAEAQALWKAEHPMAAAGSISRPWGCVGVLFRDEAAATDLRAQWSEYFNSKADPIAPVDDRGILHMPWPVTTDESRPVDVDLILATATEAEEVRPSATEIAGAWVDQNDGYERYFFESVLNGILTSEDAAIWKEIERRAPPWLNREAYAEAQAVLR